MRKSRSNKKFMLGAGAILVGLLVLLGTGVGQYLKTQGWGVPSLIDHQASGQLDGTSLAAGNNYRLRFTGRTTAGQTVTAETTFDLAPYASPPPGTSPRPTASVVPGSDPQSDPKFSCSPNTPTVGVNEPVTITEDLAGGQYEAQWSTWGGEPAFGSGTSFTTRFATPGEKLISASTTNRPCTGWPFRECENIDGHYNTSCRVTVTTTNPAQSSEPLPTDYTVAVQLWHDSNGNGQYDSGEKYLQSQPIGPFEPPAPPLCEQSEFVRGIRIASQYGRGTPHFNNAPVVFAGNPSTCNPTAMFVSRVLPVGGVYQFQVQVPYQLGWSATTPTGGAVTLPRPNNAPPVLVGIRKIR